MGRQTDRRHNGKRSSLVACQGGLAQFRAGAAGRNRRTSNILPLFSPSFHEPRSSFWTVERTKEIGSPSQFPENGTRGAKENRPAAALRAESIVHSLSRTRTETPMGKFIMKSPR